MPERRETPVPPSTSESGAITTPHEAVRQAVKETRRTHDIEDGLCWNIPPDAADRKLATAAIEALREGAEDRVRTVIHLNDVAAVKEIVTSILGPQPKAELTGDPETDDILSDPNTMRAIREAEAERPETVRTLTLTAPDYWGDYGTKVTVRLNLLSDGTVRWERTNLGGWEE